MHHAYESPVCACAHTRVCKCVLVTWAALLSDPHDEHSLQD